jgi:hypothetical protein
MRKVLSLGIAATLTAVAITAWATAMTSSQKRPDIATIGIDVLVLMARSTNLQVQQYEAF